MLCSKTSSNYMMAVSDKIHRGETRYDGVCFSVKYRFSVEDWVWKEEMGDACSVLGWIFQIWLDPDKCYPKPTWANISRLKHLRSNQTDLKSCKNCVQELSYYARNAIQMPSRAHIHNSSSDKNVRYTIFLWSHRTRKTHNSQEFQPCKNKFFGKVLMIKVYSWSRLKAAYFVLFQKCPVDPIPIRFSFIYKFHRFKSKKHLHSHLWGMIKTTWCRVC